MNCHCGNVKARLVWPASSDSGQMYNVTWQEESCTREKGPPRRRKSAAAAAPTWRIVQVSPRIDHRCRYRLAPSDESDGVSRRGNSPSRPFLRPSVPEGGNEIARFDFPQTSHMDLRQLRNDCTYSANVRNVRKSGGTTHHGDDHGISIEFFATGCRDDVKRQKSHPRRKSTRCRTKSSRSTGPSVPDGPRL